MSIFIQRPHLLVKTNNFFRLISRFLLFPFTICYINRHPNAFSPIVGGQLYKLVGKVHPKFEFYPFTPHHYVSPHNGKKPTLCQNNRGLLFSCTQTLKNNNRRFECLYTARAVSVTLISPIYLKTTMLKQYF